MAVTIKDVAAVANVAPSTVSRVIADSPRISEETKIKVKKAMEQLGYHPNLNARNLASQSTQVLGLVMPTSKDVGFQNPFFPAVLQGISEGAREKNYALQMSTGKSEKEVLDAVIQMVQGKRVDGVILLYSNVDDQVISYLREQKFPFVLIGKPYIDMEEITHVDNDNVRAAKEATEYLIGYGHEKIGFIGGSPELMVTVDRVTGYQLALKNAGQEIKKEYMIHEEFLREGGQEAVRELMALEQPPTALVVADDFMALGVLNTLDELGINVPNDLSIVSFNNVLLAEMARPPLTSVDINIFELGYQASKNLIVMVENKNEPTKRLIISHQIIERLSCTKPNPDRIGKDLT
ncbi:LacI family DNA-binding transcriptional regulator [Neobacillus sp. DY30]|uniref:LacI family DNA-binding transcriptional regulator n=1 Tax=Neobacillus sp. DY30 TaxID=3047871 RepID=UPI0024BF3DAC|nr:LacI family DNA-binding transcriptional regulator [Neobacillus sp. DY30]WHY01523.1 LacI family DNA-binding transcriptional regulator [Neobacillus sp. DY30]